MNKIYYSRYIVSNGAQTIFYSENKYVPNTKSVFVYYNGLLLVSGDDYIEKDEHNIQLTFEPSRGDVIIISPLATMIIDGFTGSQKPSMAYDEITITTTNKIFKLKNRYVPKTNTINVYLNGMLLSKEYYQEVDSETIKVLCKLEYNDKLTVIPTVKVEKNLSILKESMINKNKWASYEEFIVQDDEREFTLTHEYVPNTNGIIVYHNGVALDQEYFIEKDTSTIALKFFPEKNDIIVIVPTINPDIRISRVNGDIIGSNESSLFYRYGKKDSLMPNQKYTLKLLFDNEEKSFTFTSLYSPFYSTAKIIKMDLPDLLDDINEDNINFTIWQNSKLADELYAETLKADKDGKKKVNIKAWTRYKTEIDLINAMYINIASRAGSSQKTLGNMQVSKSIKIPYLDEMLKIINKKLEAEEIKLSGKRSIGKAARKANKSEYPIMPERRSF